jgi:hypothetical protein
MGWRVRRNRTRDRGPLRANRPKPYVSGPLSKHVSQHPIVPTPPLLSIALATPRRTPPYDEHTV